MYSIVMKDGKIINVDAYGMLLKNEDRTLALYNGRNTIGVFNMDNIAGWTKSYYMKVSKNDYE